MNENIKSTDSNSINIRILFFAKARELAGVSEICYKLSNTQNIRTYKDFLEEICLKFNLNLIHECIILAINEEYCDNLENEIQLREGDIVAIIPPISGG